MYTVLYMHTVCVNFMLKFSQMVSRCELWKCNAPLQTRIGIDAWKYARRPWSHLVLKHRCRLERENQSGCEYTSGCNSSGRYVPLKKLVIFNWSGFRRGGRRSDADDCKGINYMVSQLGALKYWLCSFPTFGSRESLNCTLEGTIQWK